MKRRSYFPVMTLGQWIEIFRLLLNQTIEMNPFISFTLYYYISIIMPYFFGSPRCWRESWFKYAVSYINYSKEYKFRHNHSIGNGSLYGPANWAYASSCWETSCDWSGQSKLASSIDQLISRAGRSLVSHRKFSFLGHHLWLFHFQWWQRFTACDFIMLSDKGVFQRFFEQLSKTSLDFFAFPRHQRSVTSYLVSFFNLEWEFSHLVINT